MFYAEKIISAVKKLVKSVKFQIEKKTDRKKKRAQIFFFRQYILGTLQAFFKGLDLTTNGAV